MFTGLIEDTGRVTARSGGVLSITTRLNDLRRGGSLAVNGVCLTMTAVTRRSSSEWLVSADVSGETMRRTAIGHLRTGHRVNLERPLRADALMDGHIVLGHVDCVVRLLRIIPQGVERRLYFELPASSEHLLAEKGSVALDGISLTVAEVTPRSFSVAVIPATWERTVLSDRRPGDPVNLEFDALARYAAAAPGHRGSSVTRALLERAGFLERNGRT
jgi:riboflavin synthase